MTKQTNSATTNFTSLHFTSMGRIQVHKQRTTGDESSITDSSKSFSFKLPIGVLQNEVPNSVSTPNKQKSLLVQDHDHASPADALFSNGRILPHAYPLSLSSRTSSVSSRNGSSSMSSSRSSSHGSSGTDQYSTSYYNKKQNRAIGGDAGEAGAERVRSPVVTRNGEVSAVQSERRLRGGAAQDAKMKQLMKMESEKSSTFGEKLFKYFGAACRECRAVEPSSIKKDVIRVKK